LHVEREQIFSFKRLLGLPSQEKTAKMILSTLQRKNLVDGKSIKKKQKRTKKVYVSPLSDKLGPSPQNDKSEIKAFEAHAGQ
jgi:hypothetical protein